MRSVSALIVILMLQACSSSSIKEDLNNTKALDKRKLPDCSNGKVLKQSELDVFKGRTPQNSKGWNQIAHCYFNRGEVGVAELFYTKTLKENSNNFTALNGLLKVSIKKRNYSQAVSYIQQLQKQFGSRIEVWEQSARLSLNYYDLSMATNAVSRLNRFSDKKFFQLYSTYLLILKDQKTQALVLWNKLNPDLFKSSPEAAFTATYLGYLLNDKMKARKFLNTAGERSNPEKFDKLSKLVE